MIGWFFLWIVLAVIVGDKLVDFLNDEGPRMVTQLKEFSRSLGTTFF